METPAMSFLCVRALGMLCAILGRARASHYALGFPLSSLRGGAHDR